MIDASRLADRQRAALTPLDLAIIVPQLQGWLMSLQQQALDQAELAYWASGIVSQINLPSLVPSVTDLEGREAIARVQQKVQTLGPRIMKTRREGAIGSVDWQGEVSASYEEAMPEGKVAEFCRELHDQALMTGIMAAMAYKDEQGMTHISPVTGFLRLLFLLEDISRKFGMFQAWQNWDYRRRASWTVRIYDFRTQRMTEWRNLPAPYMIGSAPTATFENASMPRYALMQVGPDGQPLGELMQAWPILRKEVGQQMQLARMEEATAFPFLIFSGQADTTAMRKRGPTQVFHFPQGGDAKYVIPGDLEQLRSEHDLTMARLRDDLTLPGGFAGRTQVSGEALREANVKYYNACRDYADAMTGVSNAVLKDFARIAGVPEAEITVAPNRETFALDTVDRIINLFEKGIIPLEVAAQEVQPILTTFSDEQLDEWVAAQSNGKRGVTPELVRLLLGGVPAPGLPGRGAGP